MLDMGTVPRTGCGGMAMAVGAPTRAGPKLGTLQHYAIWSRTCYRTLAYVVRSGALRCVAVSAMSYVMRFITEYCSDTAIDCDSRYMHVTRAAIRIR